MKSDFYSPVYAYVVEEWKYSAGLVTAFEERLCFYAEHNPVHISFL